MYPHPNTKPFHLNGPWRFRLRSLLGLYRSTLFVTVRRLFRGPKLPGWSWTCEVGIHYLRSQMTTGFDMPTITESRQYGDALVLHAPALDQVTVSPASGPVKGHWYEPKDGGRDITLLYLHGGGYAYYALAHQGMISLVTLAGRTRTFALDYRLIPEHPFPAQLEDAQAAYRWLLENGTKPDRLVIMGDSAGGNLVLALLLALRNSGSPLPALGVCLCPWTDVGNSGASMTTNEPYDWVEKRMAEKWADWLCQGQDRMNPLISPIHADLGGLSPIYIQAGSVEILHDMISDFAEQAKQQGANVTLDVWPNMNHDFQAFGELLHESREALARIGEVISQYVPESHPTEQIAPA